MKTQVVATVATETADDAAKAKDSRELDAALAESRIYEESREEEATMRRLRAEHAAERRRDELAELNAKTLEAWRAAVEGSPYADLGEALRGLCAEYGKTTARIDARGGTLTTGDTPLCRSCRTYHGRVEWEGLCSRCHVVATAVRVGCGPSLFKAVGRALKNRVRRTLPVPPSAEQRLSGRRLLETRLARHSKKGLDVKPDGSCQFRAISHQLFDDERHHDLVRSRALDHLKSHPPRVHDCEVYVSDGPDKVHVTPVGDDLDRYLDALARDTSWGDATTLQACADVFRVRVLLVTTYDSSFEIVVEPESEPAVKEIWLGFHSEMHYISVVPV